MSTRLGFLPTKVQDINFGSQLFVLWPSVKLLITAWIFFIHLAYGAKVVPAPDSPYGVGATQMVVLTDKTRDGPYASKKEKRSVVLSAYYPVAMRSDCTWKPTKCMPDKTADIMGQTVASFGIPKGTLNSIRLSMCSLKDADKYRSDHPGFAEKQFPLVFFSPGNANSRFGYSVIAQAVAAQGYVVVSMDHPYDAAVVEYPDGHLVLASPEADGQPASEIEKLVDSRVDDFIFALNEMSKTGIVKTLLPNVYANNAPPNLGHVPIYAHSAGGEATTIALQRDPRFSGGLNLDGDLAKIGYDSKAGLGQPYIYFASQDSLNGNDPDLLKAWPTFTWGLDLFLKKSAHGTFSDVPLLAHVLGIEPLTGDAALAFGKVPGERAMNIMTAYITAFLKFMVTGKDQKLLQAPSNDFPEVKFVRQKI